MKAIFAGNFYQPAEGCLAHTAVKKQIWQEQLAVIIKVMWANLQLQLRLREIPAPPQFDSFGRCGLWSANGRTFSAGPFDHFKNSEVTEEQLYSVASNFG